jgi:hypothetical protein
MNRASVDHLIERNRSTVVSVMVGVALLLRVGWWAHKSGFAPIVTPDTADYTGVCRTMTDSPEALLGGEVGVEYLGFTVPFCSVMHLTGFSGTAWVVVQILLSAAVCLVVYDTGRRLHSETMGAAAGMVYAGFFDSFRWSIFVLSDTFFVFAVALGIWALAVYQTTDTPTPRQTVGLGAALLLVALSRPFGPPVVGGWVLVELLPIDHDLRLGVLPSRWPVAAFGALGALVVSVSSRLGWVREYLVDLWADGQVFWPNDPYVPMPVPDFSFQPTAHSNPVLFLLANADHILPLTLFKMAAFFVPAHPNLATNTTFQLNAVMFTVVLLGSAAGTVRLFRRRSSAFPIVVLPVAAITAVVGMTYLTPFYRYRAPVGVMFALLAGYSVADRNCLDWLLRLARG